MSERCWFPPKSFGYGWTPITWEGWVLTLGFDRRNCVPATNIVTPDAARVISSKPVCVERPILPAREFSKVDIALRLQLALINGTALDPPARLLSTSFV